MSEVLFIAFLILVGLFLSGTAHLGSTGFERFSGTGF